MSPITGLVEGSVCPICGGCLWRNEGGLFYCTNRDCPKKWHGYTLEPVPQPPPQPKEEPVLGVTTASETKTLTSGQKYIGGLRQAFGYKSDRGIYRLIKEIPGINVQDNPNKALTSHNVVIAFGTNREGPLRLPFAPETESVTFCSGEWNKVEVKQLKLELKHPHKTSGEGQAVLREHPYGVFDFPLNVSGETFGLVCHIKS